jgi:rhodanese-related sulfurtransferase
MSDDHAAVPTISREELREKIARGDPFHLFEVLGKMYFRKHHLPGARNLPPDEVRALAPALVPERDAEIVLYCWDDD